jgi:hypothetical protein
MPATCKKIDGKWRVVDPNGSITKNRSGTAVDGGGHDSESACQGQARAINAHSTAPRSACIFNCPDGAVRFTEGGDEAGRFEISAYDGGITKHPYWGNLALDLKGLSFASNRLPVLDSHFTDSRVGFTTEQKIEGGVTFAGKFLKNAQAQELRKDMQDGFPMQASLWPKPSLIEQVSDGAMSEVNGHTLKGPGAIFRQAQIQEVSMCVFGALNNTRSTALAADDSDAIEFELMERDSPMVKEDKPALTVETFKAENPALHQTVFAAGQAEGIKLEKERFAALQKACGGDAVLLAECFAAGLTVAESLQKANEKLASEVKGLREQLAAKAVAPAGSVAAAVAEFKNQPAPGDPKTAVFEEAKATDIELEAHFAATAELRDRFSSAKAYVASVRHPPKP